MPPPKWEFGNVLVKRGEVVMYLRPTVRGEAGGWVGMCLRTDATGERIGKLGRIDVYTSYWGWRPYEEAKA